MVPLTDISAVLRDGLAEWQSIRMAELLFAHRDAARFALVVLFAVSLVILVARSLFGWRPGGRGVGMAAILPIIGRSPVSFIRHSPLLLFVLGVPFFILALADPFTSLARQEVSFPGRRIGLLIDASSSMLEPFEAPTLSENAPTNARFFTAVAGAETFIQMRMKNKYRDLIALIEFGDQAYVVTPFTNDYDNILLSISLIGDVTEFYRFPDQGTTIGTAIDQAVDLFTAFDYLDASGNLMVIFTDGEDTKVDGPLLGNQHVEAILSGARRARIPVHFIRAAYGKDAGGVFSDRIWRPVVEKTGGKFYAVHNEATLLAALDEIDRVSAGQITVKHYSTRSPRFSIFALAAVGLWTVALALKLTVPHLRKFP